MEYQFDNNLPIYKQLMEQIKLGIITGEYPVGEKLPSVREFALRTKVNPNTIQRALNELETEQLIYTKRTIGKFVTEDQQKLQYIRREQASKLVEEFLINSKRLGLTKKELIQFIKEKGDMYESN